MFLFLDENKVKVSEEGWAIPLVQEIHDRDQTKTKWKFQDIITGLFFIYKPETIFDNLSLQNRENEVSDKMLEGDWNEYKKDKSVKKLIDLYRDLVTTPSIRNLERVKSDMDALHEHLSSIPMEIDENIDREVEVKLEDGTKKYVRIKKRIKISNIEEKEKVYASFLKIQTMYEKLKALVEKELSAKKINRSMKRMYDKPMSVPHNV